MFLDIGVGIMLAIGLAKLGGITLTSGFLIAGVVFSLLVDSDALVYILKTGGIKDAHRHRDIFHKPFIFIPVGAVILYCINPLLALLFILCSLAHFLHDSIGIGWGIQWFYPFSTNHYTFFYYFQPKNRPHPKFQWIYIWKHDEIAELDKQKGDPHWIRHVYLELHPYALIEYSVFILALILLLASTQ